MTIKNVILSVAKDLVKMFHFVQHDNQRCHPERSEGSLKELRYEDNYNRCGAGRI